VSLARWARRARKALHRPPGYVLRRLGEELRRQGRRPWSRVRPGLLTDEVLLRLTDAASIDALWVGQASEPFFASPARRDEWSRRLVEAFPRAKQEIVEAGESVLAHEFDLLGSGRVRLGERLPWHTDFKSGRTWPLRYCHDLEYDELDRPSDAKVPWELSRCQHFVTLGQAYWVTGDERFAREFVAEVTDWVAANPWSYGINWACPMDVALRAISWIWGFYFLADASACQVASFRSLFLRSLYLHAEFLAANLERADINGNHYIVDGVGLVFLGGFFRRTRRGPRWLETGRRLLVDEIQRQVSEDGVDYEQSIAYHRLVLEACLTAALLLRRHDRPVPAETWTRLARMLEFVAAYTKPDGRAPLIGDADDGRIQKLGPQEIADHRYLLSTGAVAFQRGDFKRAAGRFWEESFWLLGPDALSAWDQLPVASASAASAGFPAGGFYVMRGTAGHLIVDCAEVGMRGRGGHGHNDVLSFELFLNGINVVTDSGAYLYTASREWRNRFRSTAFHNTVQVDDEELNRFLHPDDLWRLRDDAVPAGILWQPGAEQDYLRGSHRGYERLAQPVVHTREVLFHKGVARVALRDSFAGIGRHRFVWRFHLDPAVRPELEADGVRLTGAGQAVWLWPLTLPRTASLRIEPGWISPSYGIKLSTSVIVLEVTAESPLAVAWLFADAPLPAAQRARWAAFPGSTH
jgi:uncharacterized heparinase superfamily protein